MTIKLTTILALISLCLGILIWQGKHLGALRDELAETKILLSVSYRTLKEDSIHSGSFPISSGTQISPALDTEKKKISGSDLLKIIELEKENDSQFGFFLGLSKILEDLIDHSSEDLFTLAEQLVEMNNEEESKAGEIFMVLLLTLSTVEPEHTFDFLEKNAGDDADETNQIKLIAFAEWAEADPDEARIYLEKQDWESQIMEMAQRRVLDSLASKDFRKALTYLKNSKVHPGNLGTIAIQAAQDPDRRDEMWEILEEDLDPMVHMGISSGILGAIYKEAGLSELDEATKKIEFPSPKDRDNALSGIADLVAINTPAEALPWILRELTPEAQAQKVPKAMHVWAMRDVAAAGNWLKEQEPSPSKNAAISGYAGTVAKLDPQAALDWADEITELESQNKTRRTVIKTWSQADPQAAAAWLDQKGLARDQWLPKD